MLALDSGEGSFLKKFAAMQVLNSWDLSKTRCALRQVWEEFRHLTFAALLSVFAQMTFSVTPLEALSLFGGRDGFLNAQMNSATVEDSVSVVVGDITVHYDFPEYTRMSAVTIPNSDGSVRAPHGTKVRITGKTLQRYDGVQIQINDEPPTLASLGLVARLSVFTFKTEGIHDFFSTMEQQSPPNPLL